MENPLPTPSPEIKCSVTIAKDATGKIMIQGQEGETGMSLRDQRRLLQEGIDTINDNVMTVFVTKLIDNMLQAKIKPNGFRESSILGFLKR